MLERTIHLKQNQQTTKKTEYLFETLVKQQNHNIMPSPKHWKRSVNKLTSML
jgi:hypothetical protein